MIFEKACKLPYVDARACAGRPIHTSEIDNHSVEFALYLLANCIILSPLPIKNPWTIGVK